LMLSLAMSVLSRLELKTLETRFKFEW